MIIVSIIVFYGFSDYYIIIIIIIVVDRGLACMDWFRPNARSILLIISTYALTIILVVAYRKFPYILRQILQLLDNFCVACLLNILEDGGKYFLILSGEQFLGIQAPGVRSVLKSSFKFNSFFIMCGAV